LLLAGACALVRLLDWSTDSGDIFPPYSSLRADPIGAKALHDALAAVEGNRVERSFVPWARFRPGDAAVLLLNESVWSWQTPTQVQLTQCEDHARRGARLIVGLQRERLLFPQKPRPLSRDLLGDRWKLRINVPVGNPSPISFTILDGSWKTLRQTNGRITAIERSFGAGSVVMFADSFPFSNEALRDRRDTPLLLGALAGHRRVIFEEAHLGTMQSGSVGQLLRRYRLESAAFVLLALAGLFAWRSSSNLVPPRAADRPESLRGRSQGDALASLIRRSLTAASASQVALDVWNKSATLLPAVGASRRKLIAQELENVTEKTLFDAWRRAHSVATRSPRDSTKNQST
jgi:hypothetical protein